VDGTGRAAAATAHHEDDPLCTLVDALQARHPRVRAHCQAVAVLAARIIAVATPSTPCSRLAPAGPAERPGAPLQELDAHAGTQFDPDCVTALRVALGG
jgi:hypothetical protein